MKKKFKDTKVGKWLIQYFIEEDISLGEFEIGFISTIFGAMSAKVNTVVDFFFGGSAKRD